jgi:hypothetical protein
VKINAILDQVFDLHHDSNLDRFVKLISGFKVSKALQSEAKKLKQQCTTVQTVAMLKTSILTPHWRQSPELFDIPSNSQIFGQICANAGIQGILYPSKLNAKACIVIFPQTFANSNSFVELADETPQKKIRGRIDSTNWEEFIPLSLNAS